ncbi:hypothetical protein EFK83_06280 [Lactococcus cremoris]|uniref:hypothetical protein n=1 Tax=Lactococcus lactis subsp. cremoris TaxID=1359 RepID=UPI0021821E7E|nr:hypothetical protein [Lactococcus cremoris]MCT0446352.1 hypothetical protein [Lactococcus cremoris]MCT0452582.1 hypothetical protein [Lactococcus cremoris]
MMKQTTCYSCDKPIEPEWLPEGEFIVCDECLSETDELSVERLQEQLNTAKKALTNIKLRTERDELETYYVERNHDIRKDAIDALAAIGGDR